MLNLINPRMNGPDVRAVQRALGVPVTGVYGPTTAAAVSDWKHRVGYPDGEINNGIGVRGQGFLLHGVARPTDYFMRANARALRGLMPVLSAKGPPLGKRAAPSLALRWPIRPFDGPHPIRAPFGEPRGLAGAAPPGLSGGPLAKFLAKLSPVALAGRRNIHHGVDIMCQDGTEVFAITSGTAKLGGHDNFSRFVRVGDFDYVHLADPVREGQRVIAFETVIGRVFSGQGHVHFSRYVGNDPVNPLRFGAFVGHVDSSPPEIGNLTAFRPNGKRAQLSVLSRSVALFVNAVDRQSHGNLTGGVYRLAYVINGANGSPVVGPFDIFQMDGIVPEPAGNMLYTVQSTRHSLEPTIWYRLTLKSPTGDGWLHTSLLAPGNYSVVVTASDASGNVATKAFPIAIKR